MINVNKTIGVVLLLIKCSIMQAQVGVITNSPSKDAVLDLNNGGTTTKGLLLPKVKLTSISSPLPLKAHVEGMYVYNTETAGTGTNQVTEGEYYNDGTKWVRLQAGTGWNTVANAITDPTTNFIGTIGANDLIIKSNNTENMRISATDGSVGVGRATGATAAEGTPKLILDNGTTAGAIQIKDGTQAAGNILVSDANGVGKWQNIIFTSGAGLYKSTTAQTFPADVSTLLTTTAAISITTPGSYNVSVRWLGSSDGYAANGKNTSAVFELYQNGTKVDEMEYFTNRINFHTSRFSFTVDLFAGNCTAGDVLTIKVRPKIGNGTRKWYTGKLGTASTQMPSIIIYKL